MEVHVRIELTSPTYKEGASPQCLWTVKLFSCYRSVDFHRLARFFALYISHFEFIFTSMTKLIKTHIQLKMAPKGGIEPPTYWLTASRNYRCATWELKLFEIGATSGS